jgi:CubicO group peptidase (beta-lactamase class C family)
MREWCSWSGLLCAALLGGAAGWTMLAAAAEWPRAEPEAAGLDSSVLEALHAEFAAGEHGNVDGMLVFRNGRLLFERRYGHDYDRQFEGRDQTRGPYNYYDPDWHPYYRRGDLHTMQSVSKSVTSALIGIAIRRGELPGVDVPVSRVLTRYQAGDADPRRSALTLEHLLTMTAGMDWDESSVTYTDPRNSCASMEQSDDWVRYVLDQPMRAAPGAEFEYNSGITVLLAQILLEATGRHADDYAREHLFGPLGIERFYWKKTPTGLVDTEGGLYLREEDLARFGHLYLNDGVWEGRRILPEGWVAASLAASVRVPGSTYAYGYQWWLVPTADSPPGADGSTQASRYAYAALGYGGQRLLVDPELAIVAVFSGWNIYETPSLDAGFALRRVLGAVR